MQIVCNTHVISNPHMITILITSYWLLVYYEIMGQYFFVYRENTQRFGMLAQKLT